MLLGNILSHLPREPKPPSDSWTRRTDGDMGSMADEDEYEEEAIRDAVSRLHQRTFKSYKNWATKMAGLSRSQAFGEAQRSQVNGTLKLILPKVDPTSALKSHKYAEQERIQKENEKREQEQEQAKSKMRNKLGFAMLEAAENASNRVDFRNIVKKEPSPAKLKADNAAENIEDENYIDDSEAPPLE